MENYINANVILLPTSANSNIIQAGNDIIEILYEENIDTNNWNINRHLYITSNEEIKEGEWGLDKFNQKWKLEDNLLIGFDKEGNKRFRTDNVEGHECKKIIATTDKNLKTIKYTTLPNGVKVSTHEKQVPQIPIDFIEYYIEEYNHKGIKITDILVYAPRRYKENWIGDTYSPIVINEIHINPIDNSISIDIPKKIDMEIPKLSNKETLKEILEQNPNIKNEVIQLCIKAYNDGILSNVNETPEQWISENI